MKLGEIILAVISHKSLMRENEKLKQQNMDLLKHAEEWKKAATAQYHEKDSLISCLKTIIRPLCPDMVNDKNDKIDYLGYMSLVPWNLHSRIKDHIDKHNLTVPKWFPDEMPITEIRDKIEKQLRKSNEKRSYIKN